jgi:hypothetical protein
LSLEAAESTIDAMSIAVVVFVGDDVFSRGINRINNEVVMSIYKVVVVWRRFCWFEKLGDICWS